MKTMMFGLSIFLVLLSAHKGLSETCPEDVSPCTCYDEIPDYGIFIKCNSGTPESIKKGLVGLVGFKDLAFEIEDVTLGLVPPDYFQGLHISSISCVNCGLKDTQGADQLLGLDDSLTYLSIENSFDDNNQLKTLKCGHLKKLKTLSFRLNNIVEIPNEWFQSGYESLVDLTFSENKIRVLGDKVFASLTKLERLQIEGNLLTVGQRSMLPRPATHLYDLDISDNQLSVLPDDAFVDMPALKTLRISRNGVKRLPSSVFSPIWSKLNLIYLTGNPLECDSSIDWMFKVPRPELVFGTCASPADRKDRDLQKLIDEKKE